MAGRAVQRVSAVWRDTESPVSHRVCGLTVDADFARAIRDAPLPRRATHRRAGRGSAHRAVRTLASPTPVFRSSELRPQRSPDQLHSSAPTFRFAFGFSLDQVPNSRSQQAAHQKPSRSFGPSSMNSGRHRAGSAGSHTASHSSHSGTKATRGMMRLSLRGRPSARLTLRASSHRAVDSATDSRRGQRRGARRAAPLRAAPSAREVMGCSSPARCRRCAKPRLGARRTPPSTRRPSCLRS